MATIWEATKKTNNNTFTGTTLSSWSRQQKLAMIASFGILGLMLGVSACSKQTAKTAQVGVSNPPVSSANAPQTPAPDAATAAAPTEVKKAKKRPANVTYRDPNSGVTFQYPRKFALATGDKAQPHVSDEGVPMNFVNGGGATIATVAMPKKLYPGTDFESGFFSVNVNRSLSAEECSKFAFVETNRGSDEPLSPEKVKVGATDMAMTDEFGGDALKQAEARYYHSFDGGACYEYVLGFGTAGYGAKEGIEPVNRDEVFGRLEKILATVKVKPVAQEAATTQEPVATQEVATADPAK
jgi:hypothetical protein